MGFPFSHVYGDSHQTYVAMALSQVEGRVDGMIMLALAAVAIVLLLMFLILLYAKFVRRQPEENRSTIGALSLRLSLALSEALGLEREPEPEPPNVGLDPSVIIALPLYVYCVREAGQGHENEPAIECSVCLRVLNAGDRIRILLDCKHSFHAECIDKWLGLRATCPVCRARVIPMLQLETGDPPVRWLGPFEVVMTTTASSLYHGGTSDHEPPSRITQNGGREHCTSLRVMV